MRQNSQTQAHANSENQRSSETQYLENDEKDGNSGNAPPSPFVWKASCCLNNKKGRLKTQYDFQTTLSV
ncbi:hypothetical protein [Neisseria mucosa]|uniref:hypothetical protein n=1 Tax=Neisseria mucosa TaxID=488 RepID=UPI00280C3088|nr:hypothetical protein [Neisseria mucosa]